MTFVIEVDGERYEGKDEADAKRAMRRARAAKRKEDLANSAAYALARQRAEAAGYQIYTRVLGSEPIPRGWSVWSVAEVGSWGSHKLSYEQGPDGPGYYSRVDTEHGRGSVRWLEDNGQKVRGSLENGAGYTVALLVDDIDGVHAFAVGVALVAGSDRTTLALAELPGVTMKKIEMKMKKIEMKMKKKEKEEA